MAGLHYPDEREQRIMDGMANASAIPDGDSLDAAWSEAEAALPEGWRLRVETGDSLDPKPYWALASLQFDKEGVVETGGSTPAAALRALAAKLRERQP